jgi:hypothetical protein
MILGRQFSEATHFRGPDFCNIDSVGQMHHVGAAVHLDDRSFLPAVGQHAHGVADLESGSGAGLGTRRIGCSCGCEAVSAGTGARLKRRRRWRNLAAVRVGLRFGGRLRVAFCRDQRRELYPQRFAALIGLSLPIVLIVAGAVGVVARKNFEALSVSANVNHVHLQRRRLCERAGRQPNQKEQLQRKCAHRTTSLCRSGTGNR